MIPLGVGSDLLARLERLVAAGGGRGPVYVRSGGAYYQITGWVETAGAMYLRTRPVTAGEVDIDGLLNYDEVA